MAKRREEVDIVISEKRKAQGALKSVRKELLGIGAAYAAWRVATDVVGDAISKHEKYNATLVSLEAVATNTGRNINDVYSEMETHLGGLANKAQVAEGFLKGLTTELTVDQISQMTKAIKDASLAMGEDFGQQLPLIIKAIKQLNPAILDNIGVTVRLDQVNKKIRDGFYGVNTEINEATQQHAIFTEIMRQTAKYAGQEAEILKTNEGQLKKLNAGFENFKLTLGGLFSGVLAAGLPILNDFFELFDEKSIGQIRAANKQFEETSKRTLSLADRYDELAAKEKLTSAEQEELNRLLEDLAKLQPGIITRYGEMGEALDINTGALRDNIAAQAEANAILDRSTWRNIGDDYEDAAEKLHQLTREYNALQRGDTEAIRLALRVELPDFQQLPLADIEAQVQERIETLSPLVTTATEAMEEAYATAELELLKLNEGTREYEIAVQALGDAFVQAYNKKREAQGVDSAADQSAKEEALARETWFNEERSAINDRFYERQGEQMEEDAELARNHIQYKAKGYQMLRDAQITYVDQVAKRLQAKYKEMSQTTANFMAQMLVNLEKAVSFSMHNMVNNVMDSLGFLRTESKGVFKNMALDFVKYFIEESLHQLATSFVGSIFGGKGVLGLLGSIFDTPENDRMAMTQGRHFAQFFTRGALDTLSDADWGAQVTGRFAAPSGASVGAVANTPSAMTVHVNIQGNVIGEDNYVRDNLIPAIERAVNSGYGSLAINDDNLTGNAAVSIG